MPRRKVPLRWPLKANTETGFWYLRHWLTSPQEKEPDVVAKKDSQRINEIREKANAQRREQQRAEKRKTTFIQIGIIVGILVIVGAVVGGVFLSESSRMPAAPPSADGTISLLGTSGVPLSVGKTAVTVGKADAPVKIDLYEDYSCPHCADYEVAVGPTLLTLAAQGEAVVSFHPIRIVTAYGTAAGSAAACVATKDAQKWPDFHAALFANHSQATDGWGSTEFADYARSQGITDDATLTCISQGSYTDWIATNTDASRTAGVSGTPTLFINGKQQTKLLGPDELTSAVKNTKG